MCKWWKCCCRNCGLVAMKITTKHLWSLLLGQPVLVECAQCTMTTIVLPPSERKWVVVHDVESCKFVAVGWIRALRDSIYFVFHKRIVKNFQHNIPLQHVALMLRARRLSVRLSVTLVDCDKLCNRHADADRIVTSCDPEFCIPSWTWQMWSFALWRHSNGLHDS